MNYILKLSLLIASTLSTTASAGNVQSLRTDADGNIVASVRGEASKNLSPITKGTFTGVVTNNNNTSGGSISDGKWVLYTNFMLVYSFSVNNVAVQSGTNVRTDFQVGTLLGFPVDPLGTGVGTTCTASARGNISPYKATPVYIDSGTTTLNFFLNSVDSAALTIAMPAVNCILML